MSNPQDLLSKLKIQNYEDIEKTDTDDCAICYGKFRQEDADPDEIVNN